MPTTREIRELAAQLIEERGWFQGGWFELESDCGTRDPGGPLCVGAAISLAAGYVPLNVEGPAWEAIDEVEDELGLKQGYAYEPLENWNDAPERTSAQVIAALRGRPESS